MARRKPTTTELGLGAEWQALTVLCREVYPDVCWRCQLWIDRSLPATDRWSYTVDHMKPRKYHGPAVPHISEVRPAHRHCNSSRGAGPAVMSRRSRIW